MENAASETKKFREFENDFSRCTILQDILFALPNYNLHFKLIKLIIQSFLFKLADSDELLDFGKVL